jgi:hypothetical protein
MMDRIRRSWELLKASAAVIRADRELLVFPIAAGIGALLVSLAFVVPGFLTGTLQEMDRNREPLAYVVLFAYYVATYTVTFFFNAALVGAAMIRLEGGDPSVAAGMAIARRHLGNIVGFAVIAATVGVAIRVVSDRSSTAGRVVGGLAGLGWSLATFLVVPVLVVEGVGPVAAVRRSAELLRQTWGEQIAGNVGLGWANAILILGVIAGAIGASVLAAAVGAAALIPIVWLLAIVGIIAIAIFTSAVNAVYVAAVYRYAANGDPGTYLDRALVRDAFRRR